MKHIGAILCQINHINLNMRRLHGVILYAAYYGIGSQIICSERQDVGMLFCMFLFSL